ncbi:nitroreductase [Aeromicrobium sp.]|uniref:nitroreductase n=1 Tax=Aeromicrobium sp. TaxID=1871063 RepID=UPI003D6AD3F6
MSDEKVLERLLTDRWSCRGFTDEPVPRDVIERLLTIAQRTPSWCNTQPWNLVITSGEETRKLREALLDSFDWSGSDFEFPVSYNGIYRERRRESGWQLYEAVGVAKGDREASALQMLRNFEFFGAPHVAILTTDADLGVYGAIDCGLYVDSFLLAAQALGLGACAQAALAAGSPFLRDYFDLPDTRRVVCGISFGYADPDHPTATYRTSRADLEDVVIFRG